MRDVSPHSPTNHPLPLIKMLLFKETMIQTFTEVCRCISTPVYNRNDQVHNKTFLSCRSDSALGLWLFIRRGKQCLDFTVTVHFFHMIGCWIYNAHLPAALSWWLVNIACMAFMAVTGEYLCMRTELRAIPVNSGPKSNL